MIIVARMSGKICMENTHLPTKWEKNLQGNAELNEVMKRTKSCNTWPIMTAVLVPVRTKKMSSFAQDLFLPTLVNHAIKVEHVAKRILAAFVAILLDLVTIPIRLITAIPRMIANSANPTHPLVSYLKKEKADKKVWQKAEQIQVYIEWHEEKTWKHTKYQVVDVVTMPSHPHNRPKIECSPNPS